MKEDNKSNKKVSTTILSWFNSELYENNQDPETLNKIDFLRFSPFIILHLVCLAVFWVGWSPIAVIVAASFYFIRMFIITGFYHRYFSHKTFKMNRFWQFIFALLGSSCVQRGPLWWAAHHRHHHRYSDTEEDYHSPKKGFWWSHMFWIGSNGAHRTKYELIQDFAKYKELVILNKYDTIVPILTGVFMYYLGVFLNAFFPALGTTGGQMLIWGFFISSVVLFHGTVTINSLSHVWGRKRFKTNDTSRNNFILSLVTLGEGWHNNHHYYPGTVRAGFYWWELDITYYGLKILEKLRIIKNLRPVPEKVYKDAKEHQNEFKNVKKEKIIKEKVM